MQPDGYVIDPWRALMRHADMTAEVEARPRQSVSPFRRPRHPAFAADRLTADERAQYQLELDERTAIKLCSGMDEATAAAQARAELGCPEFWAFVNAPVALVPVVVQPAPRARLGAHDLRAEIASWVALADVQRRGGKAVAA